MVAAWPEIALGDVTLKIGSGATPRGGKSAYKDDGIALIRSLNVYDGFFKWEGLAFIDEEQAHGLANVQVQHHDVLINITGASVARCCHVPASVLPARVNQHVAIVRVIPERADSRFISYALISPRYKGELLSIAGGGATREALTKGSLESFRLRLPPLPTQRKIAAILSAYDDLIENNTRRIQILEDMARAIYREWFVEYRFPGHEDVAMVESELGAVPEGWEVVALASVAKLITRGVAPKYDEEGPTTVINQRCIRDQRLRLAPARRSSKTNPVERFVQPGDILINSTGVGTLGRVAQVQQDLAMHTVDTHVTIVRPGPSLDADYFGLQLMHRQSHFERQGRGATGQTELSKAAVQETLFLSAARGIQTSFSTVVRPLRREAHLLGVVNEVLAGTRDLLLPRLVSGELDVSDLDIDIGAAA